MLVITSISNIFVVVYRPNEIPTVLLDIYPTFCALIIILFYVEHEGFKKIYLTKTQHSKRAIIIKLLLEI